MTIEPREIAAMINRSRGAALVALLAIGGCADVQMLGATAVEQRRVMNDMQARATMAAVCNTNPAIF